MPKVRVGDETKSGGGDPNILRLQDTTRVRVVDQDAVEYRQHFIEDAEDSDQGQYVVCPGARTCPLCRKPVTVNAKGETVRLWPISRKFAINVWDYDSDSVKVLQVGPSVYDEFVANKKLGYDPIDWDFRIHKVGSGKQTRYKVVRGDNNALPKDLGPSDMHDLNKYDTPDSVESIFEQTEKLNHDYDAITVPSYTEEEALGFVMPFGKCKGMTVEQILATDPDWAEWLHEAKLSDGGIGDPVSIVLQTAMEARGLVPPLDDNSIPDAADAAEEVRQAARDGEVEQPVHEDEPDPATTVPNAPDGSEVTVPTATVSDLLAAGFTQVEQPAADPEPEAASSISDDDDAEVEIGGAQVTLKVAAVRAARDAGTPIKILDEAVERYLDNPHVLLGTEPVAEGEGQDGLDGLDKPALQAKLKELGEKVSGTKPELIARIREAKGTPEVAAEPEAEATSNGTTEDREVVLERVKDLLANTEFSDYKVLLNLFDEVAGKKDVTDFTVEELVQLEVRLKAESTS